MNWYKKAMGDMGDMYRALRQHKKEGKYSEDYGKYLKFTPENGGEYYTLMIPEGVIPPNKGDHLNLKGNKVVVESVSTPDDIARGKGGPVARSMEKNGIAYSVNCLPEGHEWLR